MGGVHRNWKLGQLSKAVRQDVLSQVQKDLGDLGLAHVATRYGVLDPTRKQIPRRAHMRLVPELSWAVVRLQEEQDAEDARRFQDEADAVAREIDADWA